MWKAFLTVLSFIFHNFPSSWYPWLNNCGSWMFRGCETVCNDLSWPPPCCCWHLYGYNIVFSLVSRFFVSSVATFPYHRVIQIYKRTFLRVGRMWIDIHRYFRCKKCPEMVTRWPVSGCFTSSHGHLESGQVGHHTDIRAWRGNGCDGAWYLVDMYFLVM